MAQRAQLMRSPVERSMSISRGSGFVGDFVRVRDEAVGLLATGTQDDDDAVALFRARHDAAGSTGEALGVGDRGAPELHDDGIGHCSTG